MTTIKAIETVYNGYRFRSRLEARWAVFFDEMNIKYEYENEGFDLGQTGWYLPDFWLPKAGWHVEVKSTKQEITQIEKAKINKFNENILPKSWGVILVIGVPTTTHNVSWRNFLDHPDEGASSTWYLMARVMPTCDIYRIDRAVLSARQARFEHGENGRSKS